MEKICQPLMYQFLNCSCWHTAFFNGLLFLLKEGYKIPLSFGKVVYSFADLDGTYDYQVDYIVKYLNQQKDFKVQAKIYRGRVVTEKLFISLLKKGSVVVVDVDSNTHSILTTGFKDKQFYLFDGYFQNIGKVGRKGLYSYHRELFHNVIVESSCFFRSKGKYSMGSPSCRDILELSLKTKGKKHG